MNTSDSSSSLSERVRVLFCIVKQCEDSTLERVALVGSDNAVGRWDVERAKVAMYVGMDDPGDKAGSDNEQDGAVFSLYEVVQEPLIELKQKRVVSNAIKLAEDKLRTNRSPEKRHVNKRDKPDIDLILTQPLDVQTRRELINHMADELKLKREKSPEKKIKTTRKKSPVKSVSFEEKVTIITDDTKAEVDDLNDELDTELAGLSVKDLIRKNEEILKSTTARRLSTQQNKTGLTVPTNVNDFTRHVKTTALSDKNRHNECKSQQALTCNEMNNNPGNSCESKKSGVINLEDSGAFKTTVDGLKDNVIQYHMYNEVSLPQDTAVAVEEQAHHKQTEDDQPATFTADQKPSTIGHIVNTSNRDRTCDDTVFIKELHGAVTAEKSHDTVSVQDVIQDAFQAKSSTSSSMVDNHKDITSTTNSRGVIANEARRYTHITEKDNTIVTIPDALVSTRNTDTIPIENWLNVTTVISKKVDKFIQHTESDTAHEYNYGGVRQRLNAKDANEMTSSSESTALDLRCDDPDITSELSRERKGDVVQRHNNLVSDAGNSMNVDHCDLPGESNNAIAIANGFQGSSEANTETKTASYKVPNGDRKLNSISSHKALKEEDEEVMIESGTILESNFSYVENRKGFQGSCLSVDAVANRIQSPTCTVVGFYNCPKISSQVQPSLVHDSQVRCDKEEAPKDIETEIPKIVGGQNKDKQTKPKSRMCLQESSFSFGLPFCMVAGATAFAILAMLKSKFK